MAGWIFVGVAIKRCSKCRQSQEKVPKKGNPDLVHDAPNKEVLDKDFDTEVHTKVMLHHKDKDGRLYCFAAEKGLLKGHLAGSALGATLWIGEGRKSRRRI